MKVSIIGAGAMGGAVASGLLAKDNNIEITVSNPSAGPLERLKKEGAAVTHDNSECVKDADIVVIAVKPWILEGVVNQIKHSIDYTRQIIALIVAGISCQKLKDMFESNGAYPQIALVMPNTAMALGESMTFIVPVTADNDAIERVDGIFNQLGKTEIIDEAHLPASMALASCGIAYVMRYMRAATEAGVELGLKPAFAQKILCQTLRGAAALLEQPGAHPESEIDKVTTPGGLTIKGLNELENAGFTSAVIRGHKACVK